jgi:hypothetical protein
MRRIRSYLRTLVLLAVSASACGGEEIDEAGAARLWQRIHDEDYRAWARAPGWESRQPTVSAHGHTADIFVNGAVASAVETPNLSEWPVDAVFVKDSYRDDSLVLIAAMEKRAGGWFFAEWDDEGEVNFGGSPSVCLDCHGAARDFVFSTVLP